MSARHVLCSRSLSRYFLFIWTLCHIWIILFYSIHCSLSITMENCKIRIHRHKSKGKKWNFKFRNPIKMSEMCLDETLCRNLSIGIARLYNCWRTLHKANPLKRNIIIIMLVSIKLLWSSNDNDFYGFFGFSLKTNAPAWGSEEETYRKVPEMLT